MTSHLTKTINLALQGGGAHGAFTWGVLDRLLEDDRRLKIEGISGTSAGAMNAAVLLQGYDAGGAEGARSALDEFWKGIGDMSVFSAPQRSLFDQMTGNWNMDTSPQMVWMDMWQRVFSPYQFNPLNYNPLRDLLEKMLDVPAIRQSESIKIFVCATNVETGKPRIFERQEFSVDAILASSCLPFTFQAVQIDNTPYWDGGFVGNPSIFPLIYNCQTPDIVLIQINPMVRAGTPNTASDIINRLNEISFNASLMAEMRAIAFVQYLIDQDQLKSEETQRLKKINMHVVSAEDKMNSFGAASKVNSHMDFLLHLKQLGQQTADAWIQTNWNKIGEESSIDIHKTFL